MFLTPAELVRLTGKRRFTAQRRALDALGIRYKDAGSRSAVEGGTSNFVIFDDQLAKILGVE